MNLFRATGRVWKTGFEDSVLERSPAQMHRISISYECKGVHEQAGVATPASQEPGFVPR